MSDTPDELAARRIGRTQSEHTEFKADWLRISTLVQSINAALVADGEDAAVVAMVIELQEVFPRWAVGYQRIAAEAQARADARLPPDPP